MSRSKIGGIVTETEIAVEDVVVVVVGVRVKVEEGEEEVGRVGETNANQDHMIAQVHSNNSSKHLILGIQIRRQGLQQLKRERRRTKCSDWSHTTRIQTTRTRMKAADPARTVIRPQAKILIQRRNPNLVFLRPHHKISLNNGKSNRERPVGRSFADFSLGLGDVETGGNVTLHMW